jgi:hypothetical protein
LTRQILTSYSEEPMTTVNTTPAPPEKPKRNRKKAAAPETPPPMFDTPAPPLPADDPTIYTAHGVPPPELEPATPAPPNGPPTPPEQTGTKETTTMTATATPDAPAAKKKASAPPMERILRLLDQQIKTMEDRTDLGEADRFQIVDGLKGLKTLVNTRDQIASAGSPPAASSAWGTVVALGRRKAVF